MKKTIKMALVLLCAFLCAAVTSGCQSNKQLNERLIVQGVGIDFAQGEYTTTLMCLDTVNSTAEKSQYVQVVSGGKTVLDALTNAISQKGQQPMYSHNMFILLGNGTAKNDCMTPLNYFIEYYETRPTVYVFTAKTKAAEIMSADNVTPDTIANLAKAQYTGGRTVTSTLYKLISDCLNTTQAAVTAQLDIKDKAVQTAGASVIQEGKEAFTLDLEQVQGILLANDSGNITADTLQIQGESQSYTLSKLHSKITIDSLTPNSLNYTVNVCGKADLYEGALNSEQSKEIIKKRVTSLIESSINTVINKYRADVLSLGKLSKKDKYKEYCNVSDWNTVLKNSKANVVVEITVN